MLKLYNFLSSVNIPEGKHKDKLTRYSKYNENFKTISFNGINIINKADRMS